MIWKVLYDFEKPNWQTFGHVLFVEAERECQAQSMGWRAAYAREGDTVTITKLDVSISNPDAQARHGQRVERQKLWLTNVTQGIPNPRRLL